MFRRASWGVPVWADAGNRWFGQIRAAPTSVSRRASPPFLAAGPHSERGRSGDDVLCRNQFIGLPDKQL